MARPIPPEVIAAIHFNLVAFGYSDLPLATVEEKVKQLQRGYNPTNRADIIGMSVEAMLTKGGFLEEESDG